MMRRRMVATGLLVVGALVAALAYRPALEAGFVFDDPPGDQRRIHQPPHRQPR